MSRPCPYPRVLGKTATEHEIDIGSSDELTPPTDADKFCHIDCGDGRTAYCGKAIPGKTTCKLYDGEAICPSCGLPTCSSCAVMSSLHERLVGDEETA